MANTLLKWAGLGGGGLKLSERIITDLKNGGYLVEKQSDDSSGPREPGSFGEAEEDYGPYLQSYSSHVDVSFYGMDSDVETLGDVRSIPIFENKRQHFALLEGIKGAGGIHERIKRNFDVDPDISDWIHNHFENQPDIFTPICSLDGGTGFGLFREHMKLIEKEDLLNRKGLSDPPRVIPLVITPTRDTGNDTVSWPEENIERTRKENVLSDKGAIKEINRRMGGSGGDINSTMIVDNNFAAFNSICSGAGQNGRATYNKVFDTVMPVIVDNDYKEFYTQLGDSTRKKADQSIIKSTYPMFMMLLRAPTGVQFGEEAYGYDHNDFAGHFDGNYIIPSYLDISTLTRRNELFEDGRPDDENREMAFLSFYTFLTSCAPINGNQIDNIKVYIWSKEYQDGVPSAVSEEIINFFEGAKGVNATDITVDSVSGINDPNSHTKIWTLTGVDDMNPALEEKFTWN